MLPILMFVVLFALVFLGVPVSSSLLATAFVFGLGVFGDKVVGIQLYGMVQQTAQQYLLSAIPPFIIMGCILERSGIAERCSRCCSSGWDGCPAGSHSPPSPWARSSPASTGIVGAVEVVIGVMTIPMMMRYGYKKDLVAGTICAGGSLGTMIPPSLVAVIYA